jgi:hypothetical protein
VGSRSARNLKNLTLSRIVRPTQEDMTSTHKPLRGPQDTHGARSTTTLNGPELECFSSAPALMSKFEQVEFDLSDLLPRPKDDTYLSR